MKIAFLNLYSGINDRGGETFSHDLAVKLVEKHEVWFLSGGKLNLAGCECICFPSFVYQPIQGFEGGFEGGFLKRLFLDRPSLIVLFFTLKVFSTLWKNGFDLIIPVNGFWQVIICKIIQLFRRGKILIVGHSGPGWDERWNLYLKPNVFVATTEPTAAWAKKVCPWTRVVTIPYGVDIERYRSARPVKLDLERPIILCPAAAVSYKRVELAIKAVANLSKASLVHLGAGPWREKIAAEGKRLLDRRFRSLAVSYSEMPGYYAICDVVTLPSARQENSPMIFLEAMAAGKPIVATDTLRNRWVIGEAGLYVDPIRTSEYARKLKLALAIDPKKIHKQAEKYSWENIDSEYSQLLESLK